MAILRALARGMTARHCQHEPILAKGISLERAQVDGGGDDAEVRQPLPRLGHDFVAQRAPRGRQLMLGCARRNELSASGRNSVSALVLERTPDLPGKSAGINAEVLHVAAPPGARSRRACCRSVRPPGSASRLAGCAEQRRPSASSMLRMRVLAAASAEMRALRTGRDACPASTSGERG